MSVDKLRCTAVWIDQGQLSEMLEIKAEQVSEQVDCKTPADSAVQYTRNLLHVQGTDSQNSKRTLAPGRMGAPVRVVDTQLQFRAFRTFRDLSVFLRALHFRSHALISFAVPARCRPLDHWQIPRRQAKPAK